MREEKRGLLRKAEEKERILRDILRNLRSAAVAFSGGVDSTYLLWAAHEELGDRCLAVTARSRLFPLRESSEAEDFCKKKGIRQLFLEHDETKVPGLTDNPPDRCYICKKAIFGNITRLASSQGISHVAEGSNMDDLGDYRPGMKAVEELGILSPLREAGLTKQEIRVLSEKHGLPTWNKPSFACLASRFVYGETISPDKLRRVDLAEQYLLENGFPQFRVRIHGENLARIEVLPEDLPKLLSVREETAAAFRRFGFLYVTMDLLGYRTGSMNEAIKGKEQDGYKGTVGKS